MSLPIRDFAKLLGTCYLGLMLVGCIPASPATDTPTLGVSDTSTPTQVNPQRLRIRNAGATEIKGLVVIFPMDRIEFGNIAPDSTTEYKTVPNGVLPYSAYSYQIDGQVKDQAVMDWIGVLPLEGSDFTYTVDFDPSRFSQNEGIKLLNVTTEK